MEMRPTWESGGDAVEENAKADETQKQAQAEAAKNRADAQAKAADRRRISSVDAYIGPEEKRARRRRRACCDRVW
jgi:hypothetical protein